jgi:hypothetical protein
MKMCPNLNHTVSITLAFGQINRPVKLTWTAQIVTSIHRVLICAFGDTRETEGKVGIM